VRPGDPSAGRRPNSRPPGGRQSQGGVGELTDVHSARVKAAKRLLKRSFREHDRAFLAEGVQSVREALADAASSGHGVRELFVTAEARSRNAELVELARTLDVAVHQASGRVMAELSDTVTPQGLVAVCDLRDVPLGAALSGAPSNPPHLVVLLAAVRDPGNAGTVLRTADAAGANAVIFGDSSVDPYNGKCVRASAGSLFHVPVVVGAPVLEAIGELRSAGLQVLAADGRPDAESLDDLDGLLAAPTAWVFGNEAWGLPAQVLQAADRTVRVPIHGRAESLNLAAAAAVCLYASARSQRLSR
jgi:RNA methyltransferase, TrmH family